tara:strand:+ start:86 stop:628 length:543 start_codon:yes stop_codon:yes gene_type:complete
MKEFAVLRGVILMILLLVSMYLVFSTVLDKQDEEKEEGEDISSMLEDFDVLSSSSSTINETLLPHRSIREQNQQLSRISDKFGKHFRQELDKSDRERARVELMDSVTRGEANRLLQSIAKPLIERDDIAIDGTLPENEVLIETIQSIDSSLNEAEETGGVIQPKSPSTGKGTNSAKKEEE